MQEIKTPAGIERGHRVFVHYESLWPALKENDLEDLVRYVLVINDSTAPDSEVKRLAKNLPNNGMLGDIVGWVMDEYSHGA